MPTRTVFPTQLVNFTALWRRIGAGHQKFWSVDPTERLAHSDPTEEFLRIVQGNVVKAHGRPQATLLSLRFDPDAATNRDFVRSWYTAGLLTSSWDQLVDQWNFKAARDRLADTTLTDAERTVAAADFTAAASKPFLTLALTKTGLAALNIPASIRPFDSAFTSGMESPDSRYKLGDMPERASDGTDKDPWTDDIYRKRIDVVMLLAHHTPAGLAALVEDVEQRLPQFNVTVVGRESGFAWKPGGGEMREPFGFVDGITNPVFLKEDAAQLPGIPNAAPWRDAVIEYPTVLAGSSYLIFRKLEQDMVEFAKFKASLHTELDGRLQSDAAEVLIGRDPSGQPLVPTGANGRNDFDYKTDQTVPPQCPFHAHIRKANPRLGAGALFVRRSLVYAETGGPDAAELGGDRGLLFLAYASRIDSTFRAMQEKWLMDPESQEPGLKSVGADPLLAPAGNYALLHRNVRGGPSKAISLFRNRLVIPRGGRYAFQPSLTWIARLPV